MFKRLIISTLLLLICTISVNAQINFGEYGNYTLTVTEETMDDLDFGQIISGSGKHYIDRNNAKTISITGVEYLDVIVEVNAQSFLYLDGIHSEEKRERIPFTLQAAYSNDGKKSLESSRAKFITTNSNSFIKWFPILERQHQPPGPPPPPPTDAFEQSKVEETAYLFLYGFINVGKVDAGHYSSEIIITINYD